MHNTALPPMYKIWVTTKWPPSFCHNFLQLGLYSQKTLAFYDYLPTYWNAWCKYIKKVCFSCIFLSAICRKTKFFNNFICSLRQSMLPHLMIIPATAGIFSPLILSSLQSSTPFGAFFSFSVWADSYFPKTNGLKVKSCGL